MSYPDIFTLGSDNGKITLQADPEIIKDLIFALNTLLDLSRGIRTKIVFAKAVEAARDQVDVKRRQENFKQKSLEVFSRFQEHLGNGCAGDKAKALQCIKQDFGIGYSDAKIYVSSGRKFYQAATTTAQLG